ncbi:MAG: uroporphyrinogen-III synthase [Rhodothermales bacterium]|jgi:uroporphyrinogen-III synthase
MRERLPKRRVLVTRAAEQAESLCLLLERAGFEAESYPTIAVLRTQGKDRPVPRPGDWLVFSSVNGVRFYLEPGLVPPGVRIAAVGTATEAALLEAGLPVDVVPEIFDAEHLARVVGDVSGRRVIIPQAEGARPVLAEELGLRGGQVVTYAAYRTVTSSPDGPPPSATDAITFTSPSTVTGYLELAGQAPPKQMVIACIGSVTSAAAQNRGLRVDVVADPHTTQGLVDGLARHFNDLDSP